MIEIYLVRHGQTVANASRRNQPYYTRLTATGREQAEAAGKTVAALQPTHFFTSIHVRAVETARMMEEALALTPETSDLFSELHRPGYTDGYHYLSARTFFYLIAWYWGLPIATKSGGESYRALRTRLAEAREFLAALPDGSRVAVVSHSIFIALFIAHLQTDRRLTPWAAACTLWRIFHIPNGSVTHLSFDPVKKHWQVHGRV